MDRVAEDLFEHYNPHTCKLTVMVEELYEVCPYAWSKVTILQWKQRLPQQLKYAFAHNSTCAARADEID